MRFGAAFIISFYIALLAAGPRGNDTALALSLVAFVISAAAFIYERRATGF